MVPWDEATKTAFVMQQFTAQDRSWAAERPGTVREIVLVDDEPAGRLYVDRTADEIRVVDITLLPEHRGAGVGTALLSSILAEADRKSLPISIHVERHNPALRLYRRIGFEVIDDLGVYLFLRRPSGRGATEWSGGDRRDADRSGEDGLVALSAVDARSDGHEEEVEHAQDLVVESQDALPYGWIRAAGESEGELLARRAARPTAYVDEGEREVIAHGHACGEPRLEVRREVRGSGGGEVEGHRRFTTAVQVVPLSPGTRCSVVAVNPARLRLTVLSTARDRRGEAQRVAAVGARRAGEVFDGGQAHRPRRRGGFRAEGAADGTGPPRPAERVGRGLSSVGGT